MPWTWLRPFPTMPSSPCFPWPSGWSAFSAWSWRRRPLNERSSGFFRTYLPGSDGILTANVEAVGNIRGLLGIASVVGLVYSSSLLFGAITRAVNRAWDVPYDRPFYIEKPRHFLMALSVAPLFAMSITATTTLQLVGSEELPLPGPSGVSGPQRDQHSGPPSALHILVADIPADLQVRAVHPHPLALHLAGRAPGDSVL